MGRGPQATWNTTRDTGKALYQFLDIVKPLTSIVESMFRAIVPEIWDIYDKAYRVLPAPSTLSAVKKSFGIWASRSIVLNAQTNLHVDLKEVCCGFSCNHAIG